MKRKKVVLMKDHAAPPGKTILLAEDDSLVRELVHEYLKDHGYKLIVAESGQAGQLLGDGNLQVVTGNTFVIADGFYVG